MVDWKIIKKLGLSFPGWFINEQGEFIAHQKANVYFNISTCESELDVKCKVLEWFSRPACKSTPFRRVVENTALHIFFLNGINEYLGTGFSVEDMREIYTYLGNACNHQKTIRFIESGYDMAVLREQRRIYFGEDDHD